MKAEAITPAVDCRELLAGAQFIDAFQIPVKGTALTARQAAERLFTRNPGWIDALLRLRNLLVTPFGLKKSGAAELAPGGMIGLFPVISETPERLVAGFDDRHLDFRVLVDVQAWRGGQQATVTTLVQTHNLLGRSYLAIVLPFHRLIVRTLLQRAFPRGSG